MKLSKGLLLGLLLLSLACSYGCARAARNTEGFATNDTITVNAPFQDTWQTAKAVLREEGYDLYTRDKRGVFIAYTDSKHRLLSLHRKKYTVSLAPASDTTTQITVETIRQVYGATLLTYPGWHDRKTEDHTGAQEILNSIQAKVSEGTSVEGKQGSEAPSS